MKCWLPFLLLAGFMAHGQGTFIYDQQSSDESNVIEGEGAFINRFLVSSQSFTPSLSAVGFISLFIQNRFPEDNSGALLLVNLRSNSVSGPIMASTLLVTVTNGIFAPETFFFDDPVPVTANTTYYFDLVRQNGGDETWTQNVSLYNYAGGTYFFNGTSDPLGRDLWFREGIYVVPEPSSVSLVLVGSGLLVWYRRKKWPRL